MVRFVARLAGLALIAGTAAHAQGVSNAPARAKPTVTLTCSFLQAPSAAGAGPRTKQRVFRIGEGAFHEWDPLTKRFGPNLCSAFTCKGDRNRLEGSITSASASYTVGLDRATRQADWRAVGATGLAQSSGHCAVTRDPEKPAP